MGTWSGRPLPVPHSPGGRSPRASVATAAKLLDTRSARVAKDHVRHTLQRMNRIRSSGKRSQIEKETEFLLAQRASAACASPLQVITTDGVSGAKRDGGTRNSVRLAPAQERRDAMPTGG